MGEFETLDASGAASAQRGSPARGASSRIGAVAIAGGLSPLAAGSLTTGLAMTLDWAVAFTGSVSALGLAAYPAPAIRQIVAGLSSSSPSHRRRVRRRHHVGPLFFVPLRTHGPRRPRLRHARLRDPPGAATRFALAPAGRARGGHRGAHRPRLSLQRSDAPRSAHHRRDAREGDALERGRPRRPLPAPREWYPRGRAGSLGGGPRALRRLLPAALVLPIALGWLALAGERAGWYDGTVKTALFAISLAVSLFGVSALSYTSMRRSVNDRRRARAELAASEARYRRTFEQARIGIAHLAPDGQCSGSTRGCANLWLRRAELLEKPTQREQPQDPRAT